MKSRKKKVFFVCCVLFFVIFLVSAFGLGKSLYVSFKYKKEEKVLREKIENAKVLVTLKDDLKIPFYSNVFVSDYVESMNGDILEDFKIDTSEVGKQEVHFVYRNEENLEIPYSFSVEVVDDVAPSVWLNGTYTIYTNYQGDIVSDIVCADNYDDNPECFIEGDFVLGKVGNYPLTFVARDASGNETRKNFTLFIKEPPVSSGSKDEQLPKTVTYYSDVVAKYKTEDTKIGIDVSGWQGEIDFEAVKKAGVEFVFIKVGGTVGTEGDYYVDSKFIRNIEGFNNVGIPVGIYFYSYAKTEEQVVSNAYWVVEQLKGHNISLPVVYDWENWSYFNEYEQSFYTLSKNAKKFLNILQDNGYDGMLYSSKNYLEKVWYPIGFPIWLAHYTDKTSYSGDYAFWQLCDNGQVDGIKGNVDIDIWYY